MSGYNPNRNKDGQFATGPKSPSDSSRRTLTKAEKDAIIVNAQHQLDASKAQADAVLFRAKVDRDAGRITETEYMRVHSDWVISMITAFHTIVRDAAKPRVKESVEKQRDPEDALTEEALHEYQPHKNAAVRILGQGIQDRNDGLITQEEYDELENTTVADLAETYRAIVKKTRK